MKIYRKEELPFRGGNVLIKSECGGEIFIGYYDFYLEKWESMTFCDEIHQDFVWCYPPEELKYTKKS